MLIRQEKYNLKMCVVRTKGDDLRSNIIYIIEINSWEITFLKKFMTKCHNIITNLFEICLININNIFILLIFLRYIYLRKTV